MFLLAALLPAYLALRGGAYDLVVRQQAGIVLWWGLALCLAFGVLPRARPHHELRLPLLALAGLAAWTALSLGWTESAERTVAEFARLLGYGGIVVLVVFGLHRGTWRAAAAGLLTAALAVSAVAVASRIAPTAFPADDVALAFGGERLSYPLDYWNAVAYWSAMALAAGVAWSVHSRRPGSRAIALAATPIAGLAVFLTYSRGGALVTVVALLMVIALSRKRLTAGVHVVAACAATAFVIAVVQAYPEIADGTGGGGGAVVFAALVLACAGCAAVSRLPHRPSVAWRRASPVLRRTVIASAVALALATTALAVVRVSSDDALLAHPAYEPGADNPAARLLDPTDTRSELWASALDQFASNPARGTGAGTFELWHERSDPTASEAADAHSAYLESLGELGIVGFALLSIALTGMLAALWRARRAVTRSGEWAAVIAMLAMSIVWLLSLALDWTWEVPAVTGLGLGGAAVGVASLSAPRQANRLRRHGRRRQSTSRGGDGWRIAAVLAAVVAGAIQIPGMASEDRIRAAEFQLSLGRLERAAEHAEAAITAEPWAASGYATRAAVRLRANDLAGAREDAQDAVRREPTNGHFRDLLLAIEVEAAVPPGFRP